MKRVMTLCILVLACAIPARSQQIPFILTHQAHLEDAGGNQVPDGTYVCNFALYDALTGGTQVWAETQNVSVVTRHYLQAESMTLGDAHVGRFHQSTTLA